MSFPFNVFYRISDNSYKKHKFPGTTKELCLRNFINCFSTKPLFIIADNCGPATLELCRRLAGMVNISESSLGNAGSLRKALELAANLADDMVVYFVEDDYFHLKVDTPYFARDPYQAITEGLAKADYVTLYDHPDKYRPDYDGGESRPVFKTKHCHWRYTISTTMTFATTAGRLRKDMDVWRKHTDGPHPHDHKIFSELDELGRTLAVCIPGLAWHTDLTYCEFTGELLMEEWVTEVLKGLICELQIAG